jgi:hypothetical protein
MAFSRGKSGKAISAKSTCALSRTIVFGLELLGVDALAEEVTGAEAAGFFMGAACL